MKRLLGAGAGLILLSLSLALETHNMPVLANERCIVGRMVKQEAKEPEGGQIRCERFIISGMPCERYEQETSEEEGNTGSTDVCEVDGNDAPQAVAETHATVDETAPPAVELDPSVPAETPQSMGGVPSEVQHQCSTEVREDPDLHVYLMSVLTEHGIQHWYPYACAQIQQESHWNPYAENVNGLDKGLLQYRITFYPGANIFDPYEQIRIYVGQVANRLNAGLSVEETISRHLTSDWVTDINWEYVNAVLSHMK